MTSIGRRSLLAAAASAPLVRPARAQDAGPVRIGVLTDMSGPYADSAGPGSLTAARMAVRDFGPTVLGKPIEIIGGDTQNKPDIASAIARQWYDSQGVDAITDLPVTPIAAAVQQLAKEKGRTVMITAAAISEFTSKLCSPFSSHWADDTHAMTTATAAPIVAGGGKTWFFITVDFAFGHALQAGATEVITAGGGRVLGAATFPIAATDFAAQLVAAQASGAQVVGLAAVGNDLVNLVKQAGEFGVAQRATMAGFLVYITDIHALGLAVSKGFTFASGFYWDQSEAARNFARAFMADRRAMPTRDQALIYVATRHFLKAMAQAGTRDPLAVGRAMRAMPVDYLGHPATLRADGRLLYDLTLYRVKAPGESAGPWDYYAPVGVLPASEAFLPMTPACAQA